jgi:glycosyltransferase involved in cell wall biosynthesis
MTKQAKVILAHEWLEKTGGSENTFEQMIAAVPDARVLCLWNNAPDRFPQAEESMLARWPVRDRKPLSLPFMRAAWRGFDLTGATKVVASSHAMAHHLAGRAAGLGIDSYAYVYSPPRYIWAADMDARGQKPLARLGRRPFRHMDRLGLDKSVNYAGISEFVVHRMRDAWGVDAQLVYPPVDTERITSVSDWSSRLGDREASELAALPDEFVLGASRLIEYKRLDVAMEVGEKLGLPVVIAGDGPIRRDLEAFAASVSVPVHFVGRVSDEGLFALYQRASLFVFMPIEDFGIMPIEAMALGTPVLVRDVGGTREVANVLGGGIAVNPDDRSALATAAREALVSKVPSPTAITQTFSHRRFKEDFGKFIGS